jgi:UDP-N-acetylmuramate--alanine ligase
VVVITNIEMDHPDCYRDLEDMVQTFNDFLTRVPADGLVVACGDDAQARSAVKGLSTSTVVTYGLGTDVDWRALDLQQNALGGTDFRVMAGSEQKGWFQLGVPGNHNVSNALAAIVVSDHLGVEPGFARDTLKNFQGVGRRFEVKGEVQEITVVDDYAHHPSEIKATLAGARKRYNQRRIWVVFQPHTYSRTRALLAEFATAFENADRVMVTPVYAAREMNTLGIGSSDLVSMMSHPGAEYVASLSEATSLLARQLVPGDVLITMGAGDVWRVGEELVATLGNEDDDSVRES